MLVADGPRSRESARVGEVPLPAPIAAAGRGRAETVGAGKESARQRIRARARQHQSCLGGSGSPIDGESGFVSTAILWLGLEITILPHALSRTIGSPARGVSEKRMVSRTFAPGWKNTSQRSARFRKKVEGLPRGGHGQDANV